jgi:ASC-1-like (ASCH) protein
MSMQNHKMTTHLMNLQPFYFERIKEGTKKIELRLYDEKRQKINIGDSIVFSDGNSQEVKTIVKGLLRYDSFEDIIKDFTPDVFGTQDTSTLLKDLQVFYPPEKQSLNGILGIRIELI